MNYIHAICLFALTLGTIKATTKATTEAEYELEFCKLSLTCKGVLAGTEPVIGPQLSVEIQANPTYDTFKLNYDNIVKLRSQNIQYEVGTSVFTLLTTQERNAFKGLVVPKTLESKDEDAVLANAAGVAPESKNWVEEDKVTDIRYQGSCGSCWAFATIATVESAYAIKTGVLQPMSEQQVIDCALVNCYGCNGGWMPDAYKAIRNSNVMGNRLPSNDRYPYAAVTNQCNTKPGNRGRGQNVLTAANISEAVYVNVKYETETEAPYDVNLANAVAIGPVAVGIQAVDSLFAYKAGVYTEDSGCLGQIDHAVVVVGYTQRTFTIRNSWGAAWGEAGYVQFDRNIKNQCSIAMWAMYPLLQAVSVPSVTPCTPNPCEHKGKCVVNGGSFSCRCKKKWTGDTCSDKKKKSKVCKDKNPDKCPKDPSHKKCSKRFGKTKCQKSCGYCKVKQ